MFKWFGNLVDSHDKELERLRKIVDRTNERVVELLQQQLEDLADVREQLNGIIHSANADSALAGTMSSDLKTITAELKRLAAEAPDTRRVIEQGDTGARSLNTLVASRKEMMSLDQQRQKSPAAKMEVEDDLLRLRRDVQDELRALAAQNAKLDELVARLPELAPLEMKPGEENKYYLAPDALNKLVDEAEQKLGPEIRGYFERLNILTAALRRAVAYSVLLNETSPGKGAAAQVALGPAVFGAKSSEGRDLAAPLSDMRAAIKGLLDALTANDLMRHMQRQGLLLPADLAAAPAPAAAPQARQQSGGGLFRRNKAANAIPETEVITGPSDKDDLADLLTWQESAVEEYFLAADRALNGKGGAEFAALRERFQAFEGRLASRVAEYRGRILSARADLWRQHYSALSGEVGADIADPFFAELAEQEALEAAALAQIEADANNNHTPPVAVKPPYMGELMSRRDKLIADGIRRLTAHLRAEGERDIADRLKTLETDYRAAERKSDEALLNDILPELFATAWEASRRTIGLRPANVQIMGATTMHEGKIAEMRTGEGKTLTAALPLALNAVAARGSHLVTVNEYLVQRDADWMGPIYALLGLTVGVILNDMAPFERVAQYRADITYGTNSEFGFDYLRDNTAPGAETVVQRPQHYCIVDEVDNILIDEARTPLIISGMPQQTSDVHERAAAFARHLRAEEDYTVDEKARSVVFTDEGISRAERYFNTDNLYHPDNFTLVYGLDNALKAWALFKRDKDYVLVQGEDVLSPGVRPNPKQPVEVVIVDEFTGRLMPGRRYSEGLHEAIEAKEGIAVRGESLTYATITIQNYFRLYPKLAGMTGTAMTEAEEFYKIYKLEVTAVPTRLPMVRQDFVDRVYRTELGKFRAVVQEIKEETERGRPVLVGTVSIEKSEELSKMLDEAGIAHTLLNAKQHEREASIVTQAGQKGAVTIATNMAGRGTDITLGFGVAEVGGLHIIGTERHESRRIDNQLRGRAGRQGDPGSSRFYVSMEDEIMRRSGMANNVVNSRLFSAVWEEDQPIEYNMVSKSVEQAQTKMEGFNFDLRKHLVEYDDVVNTQRDVIYKERRYVLLQGDPQTIVRDMLTELVDDTILAAAGVGPDGRMADNRKRDNVTPEQFFESMSAAFSDELMGRLVRNILRDYLASFIEAGDRDTLVGEAQNIAQEAYDNSKGIVIDRYDKELQKVFHVGDVMYENVAPDVDFNKLLRTLTQRELPIPADVSGADFEGMDYAEAQKYFTEFADEWFEREISPRLDDIGKVLVEAIHRGDATQRQREIRDGRPNNDTLPHPAEEQDEHLAEAGALLDIINARFALAADSAAARVPGGDEMIDSISNALEELYEEVETQMGREFLRRLATSPLVSLAGTQIPVSSYREIEQQIGVEKLEEIESTALGDVEPDIQQMFIQAFLRDQEGHWILRAIDDLWTRHLTGMEALRESIGLQAYAQRDPLVEYKRNAYELFGELKRQIRQVAVGVLSLRLSPQQEQTQRRQAPAQQPAANGAGALTPPDDASALVGAGAAKGGNGNGRNTPQKGQRAARGARNAAPAPVAVGSGAVRKVGRNDPCPCGSGKKYKMCHGR